MTARAQRWVAARVCTDTDREDLVAGISASQPSSSVSAPPEAAAVDAIRDRARRRHQRSDHQPADSTGPVDERTEPDDEPDLNGAREHLGGPAAGSLRYWLTWGVPVLVLVVFGAYLLLPRSGPPAWLRVSPRMWSQISPQPSIDLDQSTARSGPSPSDPAELVTSTPPQPQNRALSQDQVSGVSSSPLRAVPATAGAGGDPPAAAPADVLAGPVDDGVLQQLLTQSMPERLAASDPDAASSPTADRVAQEAWRALRADLDAGGWSHAHLQAHELVSKAPSHRPGQLPQETTVIIMWSATSPAGELQDRQLSVVRMDTTGTPAAPREISTP